VGKESSAWTTSTGRSDTKLLVDGGPDFRRSRFASNSWTHRASKSLYCWFTQDRQSVPSLASIFSWDGVISHCFSLSLQSYRLYCLPDTRNHEVVVHKTTASGMCVSSMQNYNYYYYDDESGSINMLKNGAIPLILKIGKIHIHFVRKLILNTHRIFLMMSLLWCHLFTEQCLSVYYFLHQFSYIIHKW